MDNLIAHARRELDLFTDEDPEIRAALLKAVEGYASYDGHSGGSHYACLDILDRLLRFQNLTELTDSPDEWMDVSAYTNGDPAMWQSRRNSEAFSDDRGKTYWLLSEGAHADNREPRHTSRPAP